MRVAVRMAVEVAVKRKGKKERKEGKFRNIPKVNVNS